MARASTLGTKSFHCALARAICPLSVPNSVPSSCRIIGRWVANNPALPRVTSVARGCDSISARITGRRFSSLNLVLYMGHPRLPSYPAYKRQAAIRHGEDLPNLGQAEVLLRVGQ